MLSVTDNSQEARGDAWLVAPTLPISEVNLVILLRAIDTDRRLTPVHQSIP